MDNGSVRRNLSCGYIFYQPTVCKILLHAEGNALHGAYHRGGVCGGLYSQSMAGAFDLGLLGASLQSAWANIAIILKHLVLFELWDMYFDIGNRKPQKKAKG